MKKLKLKQKKMKKMLLYVFTAAILLLIPNLNFGQAPNLGATSSFALFTAGGALTNSGASYIEGNIGSYSATSTGFPGTGVVTGTIYASGADLDSAFADVSTAYAQLFNLSCDSTIGTSLGSGQILTPKVYCLDGASSLTGTLTLDGKGNPNSVFVFRIVGGAFATATNTTIKLINSASQCNVYWMVGGQFTLNSGSVFYGTVIADGAITISGATLRGRALTTAGSIITSAINDTIGCGTVPPSITIEPTNQTGNAGSSISFSVTATGSALTYQWQKGGVNIVGATSSTYTIPSLVAGNSGNYDVVVSGTLPPNDTSSIVSLTVNTSPAITVQPINKTTDLGVSVTFSVTATGEALTYQWQKGGVNINGATASTYTIASPVVSDTGKYEVVVSGTLSPSVTSNPATLTINLSPAITVQPTNQMTCTGTSVSFSVTATGAALTY
jgi:hypothetical protein